MPLDDGVVEDMFLAAEKVMGIRFDESGILWGHLLGRLKREKDNKKTHAHRAPPCGQRDRGQQDPSNQVFRAGFGPRIDV